MKAAAVLRILGLAVVVAGLAMLWDRGIVYPVRIGESLFPIPVYIPLLLFGAALSFVPLAVAEVIVSYLPAKLRPMARRLLRINTTPQVTPPLEATRDVAQDLDNYIRRATRRYVLTVLALGVCAPFLIMEMMHLNEFAHESERLVAAVQETSLDFAAADTVSQYLFAAEPDLRMWLVPHSSTRDLYEVLHDLYVPTAQSASAFDTRMGELYKKYIYKHVDPSTGLLKMDEITVADTSVETVRAPITYLSVLALLCSREGDHGKHLDPYLQSTQLLSRAATLAKNRGLKIPMTKNLRGRTSVGLLRSWKDYDAAYAKSGDLPKALGEGKTPRQIPLARRALDEYQQASEESWTALSKARYTNNRVDLMITLLYDVHLDRTLDPNNEASSADDTAFVERELVPGPADVPDFPERIIKSLTKRSEELDVAINIRKAPEIYFTHAQLFVLGGRLAEKYGYGKKPCPVNAVRVWCSPSDLAESAIDNLRLARSAGLLPRFFANSEAGALRLDWLWHQKNVKNALEAIARQ